MMEALKEIAEEQEPETEAEQRRREKGKEKEHPRGKTQKDRASNRHGDSGDQETAFLRGMSREDQLAAFVYSDTEPVQEEARGRSRDKAKPTRRSDSREKRLKDTYYERSSTYLKDQISECYETRQELLDGSIEISPEAIARTVGACSLDVVGMAFEVLDHLKFGMLSTTGQVLDMAAESAGTGIRRSVRWATDDQRLGQNAGDITYLALSLAGPKKLLAPAQAAQKALQVGKTVKAARSLQALDLAETVGKVTGGSSTKLGKNMLEAMGLKRNQKWSGYEAHHVIPSDFIDHAVLKKIGMDLDHASNGFFLRVADKGAQTTISPMSRHTGFHGLYNKVVESQLNKLDLTLPVSQLRNEVYNLQSNLKKAMQQGLPLYENQVSFGRWEQLLGNK
jgi:hypothetical protein